MSLDNYILFNEDDKKYYCYICDEYICNINKHIKSILHIKNYILVNTVINYFL